MKYTINIGDEIAKLYGTGKSLTDNQGNWLWDRVLKDTPFPDTIRNITAEYLEAYFQKFDSVPNSVLVEENADKVFAVDNANQFVWTKDNRVAPITAKLVAIATLPAIPQTQTQTYTATTKNKVHKITPAGHNEPVEHTPTKHGYRGEAREDNHISVLNPIYFPYVFAFKHQFLWGLWVITKFLGLFTLKVAKASLELGWVATYWTFKLMWMIAKYGMIISVATLPILCRVILICFSFGLMGMPRKKRKRR